MVIAGYKYEVNLKKLVFFIVFFEMFQKFSMLGFQSVLFLFLKHEQKYTLHNSLSVYHLYVGVSYLVPIIGTIIADLYMNKVLTILLISVLAVVGQIFAVIVAVAVSGDEALTLPLVMDNARFFVGFGLMLRAFGVGGVREVTSSLGDEHFHQTHVNGEDNVEKKKEKKILHYFITVGTLLAFIISPALRMNVHCYGNPYCFPLALGLPGLGTIMAVIILMAGYSTLYSPSPRISLVVEFFMCIKAALSNHTGGGLHWIDNASHEYEEDFLDDVKLTLHVLPLFIPLPIFWALFEQMGSQWVAQGTQMNTTLDTDRDLYMEPEQMQIFSPLFVLVLFPIMEYLLIPLFAKTRFCISTPKQWMFIGAVLAVASFLAAGYVEYKIEPTRPVLIKPGEGGIMLFNVFHRLKLQYTIKLSPSEHVTYTVAANEMLHVKDLPVVGTRRINISMFWPERNCGYPEITSNEFEDTAHMLIEQKTVAILGSPIVNIPAPCNVWNGPTVDMIYTSIDRCDLQLPKVGVMYHTRRIMVVEGAKDFNYPGNLTLNMMDFDRGVYFSKYLDPNHGGIDFFHVSPGRYQKVPKLKNRDCRFRRSGVYIMMLRDEKLLRCETITSALEKRISIWWQVPQYFLISFGEYLFPLILLGYSLAQTPERMKSVVWNFWLLTVAMGNFLVAFLSFLHIFERQLYSYCLYAGLMAVNCVLLFILFFTYVEVQDLEITPSGSDSPDWDQPSDNSSESPSR